MNPKCSRCQAEIDTDVFPSWRIEGELVCQDCLSPEDYQLTSRMAAMLKLGSVDTDWRNYELEEALEKTLGGAWAVAELCPYNGEGCRYGELGPSKIKSFWGIQDCKACEGSGECRSTIKAKL